MIAVLVMLGIGAAFLLAYAAQLGQPPWHLWHHLAVLLPALMLGYASVRCVARLSSRRARAVLAWLVCLLLVCLQLGFYAACLFTLYGFHDLPTKTIVLGYFDQIGTIAAALPISHGLLAIVIASVLIVCMALAAFLAWLMLRSAAVDHSQTSSSRVSWPRIALLSLLVLGLLLSDPWEGLSRSQEPLVSSLHDHSMTDTSHSEPADPVEMAIDLQLAAAYPRTPLGTRRHVVLIYIDAMRADVLQPYGGDGEMPFLTERIRSGELHQFDNVFASCSQTLCGITSILQSRPAHRVALGKLSLPMVLKLQGYQLRYLLSSDHEHFLGLKKYYGPGIDEYIDGKDMDPHHSTDDLLLVRNLSRLPAADAVQAPQFIMFGLMSVHVQGERHADFRLHLPDIVSWLNGVKGDVVQPYRNHYLNGVRQADYVLEQIWHWLDQAGYLKDSIIVITADHGESLGENGTLGHARDLSTPELHIPLWIRVPDSAWIEQPFAFQTDIAPTVLDWLQLPVPASWTGQSLLRARRRGGSQPLFFLTHSDRFGLILDEGPHLYKYLYEASTDHASLFDLYTDNTDSKDLLGTLGPGEAAAMKSKLIAEFGPFMRH